MKFSARGAVLAMTFFVCFTTSYFLICAMPMVVIFASQRLLGKKACQPFVRLGCALLDNSRRMYSLFMSGCLQLILGIRVGYTIVDPEGPDHLRKHFTKGDGTTPDLHRLMQPPSKVGTAKIVMMNHHCRIDPLCVEMLFAASDLPSKAHIVPKQSLGSLPIVGWSMQLFRFLFLSRSWADDEGYLRTMIQFLKQVGRDSPVIFLFPEGTDLSESNIVKSNAFAQKNGLPEFRHVLNPRTTGLIGMKNFLGENALVEIIDVTVGYVYGKGGKRPSEPSFVNGEHPRKVHFVVKRHPVITKAEAAKQGLKDDTYAPSDDDVALSQWVHARFAEKEQLLSRFITTNPQTFDEADVKAVFGESCGVATYDEDMDRLSGGPPRVVRFARQVGVLWALAIIPFWYVMPFAIIFGGPLRIFFCICLVCGGGLTGYLLKTYGNLQTPLFVSMVTPTPSKSTKVD